MASLFIISSCSDSEIALKLARGIKLRGGRVILIFRGEGLRLLDQPCFEEETGFADGVYILDGECLGGGVRAGYVRGIGPDELVALMEACERVVSWV